MNQHPSPTETQSRGFFVTEKPPLSPSTVKSTTASTNSPFNRNKKSLRIPIMPTRTSSLVAPPSSERSSKILSSQRQRRTRPPSLQNQAGVDCIPIESHFDFSRPGSPPKSLGSMMNYLESSNSPGISPGSAFRSTKFTWRPDSPQKSLLKVSSLSRGFSRTCSSGFRGFSRECVSRGSPDTTRVKETTVDKAIMKVQNIIDNCYKLQEEYVGLEKSLQDIEIEQNENSPKIENDKKPLKFDFWKYNEGFRDSRTKLRMEMDKVRDEENKKQELREFVESKGGIENINKKKNKKGDVLLKEEDLQEPNEMVKFILQKPRTFSIKRTPSSTRKAERLLMPDKGEKIANSPANLSLERSQVKQRDRASTLIAIEGKVLPSFNLKVKSLEKADFPSITIKEYRTGSMTLRENQALEIDRAISPIPIKSINELHTREIKGGFADLFSRDKSRDRSAEAHIFRRTPSMILNDTVCKVQKMLDTPKLENGDLFHMHKKGNYRKSVQKMYRGAVVKDL